MRIGRPTPPVVLTAEERLTLEQWARRPTTAQGLAQRRRLVLAFASSKTNGEIAAAAGGHATTRGPLAASLRAQAAARSVGRAATRRAAQDYGCRGRVRDRAHAGAHAAGRHALEYPRDGEAQWPESDGSEPDLASLRAAAAPQRDVQALHRPAVYRQSARHRRAVSRPAGQSPGAVRRRKIPDPGARSDATSVADAPGASRASHARLHATWNHHPLRGLGGQER